MARVFNLLVCWCIVWLTSAIQAADPIVVEPGFEITLEASNFGRSTQITFGPDGRLYVANLNGTIRAFDYGKAGILGDAQIMATGVGALLLGIGFDEQGFLYASSNNGADDTGFIARLLDNDNDGTYETQQRFVTNLPNDGHHNDQIAIDGHILYFGMGSRTDDGEQDDVNPVPAATLLRIDLGTVNFSVGGNLPQVYAHGLRNAFGITIDEQGRVWVGDNGRDTPLLQDTLHRVNPGGHHGFPDELAPKDAVVPVAMLGFGTSADGLDFYPSDGPWGPAFVDNIFITRFDYEFDNPDGIGMDVVRVVLDRSYPDKPQGTPTVFAKGFHHPLDAEVDPFGNLLIMEHDNHGPLIADRERIFRIARTPPDGDWNSDKSVDLGDYANWPGCMHGAESISTGPGCSIFDLDLDGDVDLNDFHALAPTMSR